MPAKTILLIESEVSIREVLHICLREIGGWQVMLSSSIQEGVNLCREAHLDAILLDTSTSESDALLFVEQLKRHSITQSIPILLLTARARWFTAEQLRQIGFAGAIEKPFDPITLSTQIIALLESNQNK